MVVLRKDQEETLARGAASELPCRVLSHVKTVLPAQAAALGDVEARRIVVKGIGRAAALGIESDFDVVRFVDLMFVLGEDFPEDPALPWAAACLDRRDIPSAARLDLLWAECTARLAGSGRSESPGRSTADVRREGGPAC